jgi:hypothetical protein
VILDWTDINTSWEQLDLVKKWSLKKQTRRLDPGSNSWKPKSLVYRRVLSWQLRAQKERVRKFLGDWNKKEITVVGGWSSDVGMSKGWPAILKPDLCPQTFFIDEIEKHKVIGGNKDGWVIKGVLSFSGQAVFRGKDYSVEQWNALVEKSLMETKSGRAWIVQELLEVPLYDGQPLELGIYMLNGKFAGTMARWGSSQVISDTSTEKIRPVELI